MLGKTDLSVSEICLGSMYFGWREPKEQSLERLDQFIEAGGNFIDTANIYAMHHLNDKDYFGKDRDLFIFGHFSATNESPFNLLFAHNDVM